MAPRKKISIEERKLQKRIAEKLRYERLKNDPDKAVELKIKNQEKKRRRKREGKDKLISAMSEREKRAIRKKWRTSAKISRQKNKNKIQDLEKELHAEPLDIDFNRNQSEVAGPSSLPATSVANRVLSGMKRRRYNRDYLRGKMLKLEEENIQLKKKIDSIRKRYERERRTNRGVASSQSTFLSPRAKVENMMKKNDSKGVKKRLLFGESLVQQLQDNWKSTKSTLEKRRFTKAILGNAKWLKKYGLLGICNFISTKCLRNDIRKRWSNSCQDRRARKITSLVKAEVQTFLEEEDHSRVCPGKKECITRGKIKKQKRLLQASLQDLHKTFLETRPFKISYASFCRLKPFWIVTPNVAHRDTCQCVVHENFHLLLRGLSSGKAIASPDPTKIKSQLCCDTITESCLLRTCKACRDNTIRYETFDGALKINYQQWIKTKVNYIDPKTKTQKTTNRVMKQTMVKPIIDIVRKTEQECSKFLSHEGKVFHQHSAIKKLKASLHPGEILVHCDFSENYATKYHGEIQSVHFGGNRLNLSLHTVVVYYRKNHSSPVSLGNFCSISTNLDHGPAGIWAHFSPIFDFLHELTTPITKIHFLSDGPSSQYRNKTLFFFFMNKLHQTFEGLQEATWNYHEAGHGKGAPDGIGAVVKRTADRTVAQGKDVVDIETFVTVLRAAIRNIQIRVIESSAIEAMSSLIPPSLKPFQGTMEVHQVVWKKGDPQLYMNKLSCFSCSDNCKYHMIGMHQPSTAQPRAKRCHTAPAAKNENKKPTAKIKKKLTKTKNKACPSRRNGNNAQENPAVPEVLREVTVPPITDEFSSHLTAVPEDMEMQEILCFLHTSPIPDERFGSEQLEPSLDAREDTNTNRNVTEGLCFKCGGAVSAVKIGVTCEICQKVIYHAACVPSAGNNDIDIFCCESCDKMAIRILNHID